MFRFTLAALFIAATLFAPASSTPAAAKQRPVDVEALKAQAKKGNPLSQYSLGALYEHGQISVKQDYAEAAKWYRRAAEQGHQGAQYELGSLYLWGGLGLEQDYSEAYLWLVLASQDALRDTVNANLARRDMAAKQLTSEQIAAVEERVRIWKPVLDVDLLQAGAGKGLLSDQWQLAKAYEQGLGDKLPQNYEEAYFWATVVATEGDETVAAVKERIAQHLTLFQLMAVDKRAADWMKAHPVGTNTSNVH